MTLADWQLLGCVAGILILIRVFYGRLVSLILRGRPVMAAAMVVFVSPVMLALIVTFAENRSLSDFSNLGREPWSLIFGDTFLLSAAAAVAAVSARCWKDVIVSDGWVRLCLLIGVAAGLSFHLMDVRNYRRLGTANLTDAISKVYHDGIVYPVLFGTFVLITYLMIQYGRGGLRIVYLLCLAGWLALAIRDMNAGLNPHDFHTACNVGCGLGHVSDHLTWLHWAVGKLRDLLNYWHFA